MGVIADLIVNLRAEVAQFRSSMDSAADSIDGLQKTAQRAGEAIAEYLAVREVVSQLKEAVDATQEWALSIEKLNSITGVGAVQAGALAFAAKENGVQLDSLQAILGRLSRELATNEKAVTNVAGSIRDANGQFKTMPTILDQIIGGLLQFREGADRDAAAASVLGRSAAQALPDLVRLHDAGALTTQGMADSALEVEKFGLTVDASGVAKAREYEKALNDLSLTSLALKNQFGQALLPEIERFSEATKAFVQDREHMEEIRAVAQDLAAATLATGNAVIGAIKLWNEHKVAIGATITVLGVLAGSFVAPEVALGAIALRAIFFIGALVGIKSAADGVNESLGRIPGSSANLQKILDSSGGKFEPFTPAGQNKNSGDREFVDSKITESIDKETAKIREQIAMLTADHSARNEIARAQAEINALTEKGVSAASAAGRAIIAAVDAQQHARAQLEIVKSTAAAEDTTFGNQGQLKVVQASAEQSRALGEQIAVENVLRKANVDAASLQTDAVQKLVAATREEYQSRLQLKDAERDKTLRENIQTQQDAIAVAQLNHGFTVQEIQDRRDLETRYAVEQALFKDNLSATSDEGVARARLVEQLQAQKYAMQDIATAQAEIDAARQPLDKYVQAIDLYNQQLRTGLIDQETFNRLLQQAGTNYTVIATAADTAKEIGKKGFEDLGTAIIDLANRTKTFQQSIEELSKSLEEMILKELVVKQLERGIEEAYANNSSSSSSSTSSGGGFLGLLSGLFGSGSAASGASSGAASDEFAASIYHSGGVSGSASSFRSVSSGAFAGARRYHFGNLGPNEEAAVLEKGEGIIPRGVMEAARTDRGSSSRRVDTPVNQTFVYHGPDADGFLKAQSHMLQDGSRAARNMGRHS